MILWRSLARPGHEIGRLRDPDRGHVLEGTAVFVEEGRPCRLDYSILCDDDWRTASARVAGWHGDETVRLDVAADRDRRWLLNGAPCPDVDGCMDVDLSFSPSTNLLPIRRLRLAVGERASVRAAWVRFPGCTVEPLEQVYERVSEFRYQYSSGGGRFVTLLTVNPVGFVTLYPDLWEAISG